MRIVTICFLLFPVMLKAQIGAKAEQQGGILGIWQNSQFGLYWMENPTSRFIKNNPGDK